MSFNKATDSDQTTSGPHSRRRIVLTGVGAIVILAASAVAWAFWPRGTTEVSREEALKDFRDRAGSTTTEPTGEPNPTDTGSTPAAGVYTYRASGEETVKLGPFPEETRPLPETVSAVVVSKPKSCFDFTLNFFEEHTEDTLYCDADGTFTLESHAKHQKIGPASPTANITCDPRVLTAPGSASQDLACKLELEGGPMKVTAEFEGVARTGAAEKLTIGGKQVTVTPVTIDYDITGSVSGSWHEKLWLTAERMPARIERKLDLKGPATFHEDIELELTSLSPAT
ncbi:MAG: hypothetical protein KDB02_10600 [Acidimicrobiales bacterium]|nr:hypothetical protein [Acidimicrobiales bacterium]